jgi:DNA-directed RNA polymerase beta subunit
MTKETLLDKYFDQHSLVQQQLESYNEFIRSTLFDIVEVNKSLSVTASTPQGFIQKHIVTFGQTHVGYPTVNNPDGKIHL